MDMSKYREIFFAESREHLKRMGSLALVVEQNPADSSGIDALFREAHSIKGMAASMAYEQTTFLAHHLEDLLDGCRKSGHLPSELTDRLLAGIDLLEELLEDLESGRPEREVADFIMSGPVVTDEGGSVTKEGFADSETEPSATGGSRQTLQATIRLVAETAAPAARALLLLRDLAVTDRVVFSQPSEEDLCRGCPVSSLTVLVETAKSPDRLLAEISGMVDVEQVIIAEAPAPDPSFFFRKGDAVRSVRVSTDLLDRFINLTGELITNRYILQSACKEEKWEMLRQKLDDQARLITDLHHQVLRVRMHSLESVTGRLPRLVRELARKTGKEIVLRLEGQEVELDRAILEHVADPVVHMVRNAIDHGIETRGTVTVRAWREKDQVLLEVRDNGRGMNPEAIRRKAVEKGLLTADRASAMADSDVLLLVCEPGFTTAEEVTETSGRGVGMDIVKAAVVNMGGTLEVDSRPGRGTCFRLCLPLSIAIVHLLLVECAGHRLGIPFSRVVRAAEVDRRAVQKNGRVVMQLDGEEVPLLSLRKILGLPAMRESSSALQVVISEFRGRKIGLVVDRLAGQRQAFIKTLNFPLDRLAGINGATILGDGSIVFIIDPPFLLEGRISGREEHSHALHQADGKAA